MSSNKISPSPPFCSINKAAELTGLSRSFIRKAVADGTIPHTMSGNKVVLHVETVVKCVREMME